MFQNCPEDMVMMGAQCCVGRQAVSDTNNLCWRGSTGADTVCHTDASRDKVPGGGDFFQVLSKVQANLTKFWANLLRCKLWVCHIVSP